MSQKNSNIIPAVLTIAVVAFTIYVTGFINMIQKGLPFSLNPNVLITYMIQDHPSFWLLLGVLAVIICLSFFLIYRLVAHDKPEIKDPLKRSLKMSEGNQSYGESHFAEPKEYEEMAIVQPASVAYGPILGVYKNIDGEDYVINFRMDHNIVNPHMVVIAPSRGRKTSGFVIPNIFQAIKRHESLYIMDLKGELAETTIPLLMEIGYDFKVLNLKDPRKSDGWNLFSLIREDMVTFDCDMISEILIKNLDGGGGADASYMDSGLNVLSFLLQRVFYGTDFADDSVPDSEIDWSFFEKPSPTAYKASGGTYIGRKNLESVYNMLLYAGGISTFFTKENLQNSGSTAVKQAYDSFAIQNEKFQAGVLGTVGRALRFMTNPDIKRIVTTNDIELDTPGKKPCIYFCVFPSLYDTYKSLSSLFFSMAFIKLEAYANSLESSSLPVPVNFMLDEFPSIGLLPAWNQKLSMVASLNIRITMILQSIAQLEHIYNDFVSILANCATIIVYGCNDEVTAKWLESRFGDITVEVQNVQHPKNEGMFSSLNGSYSYSAGEGRRKLVSQSEFTTMSDINTCFIKFERCVPIWCNKFYYKNHEYYKLMPCHEGESEPYPINMAELPNLGTPEREEWKKEIAANIEAHKDQYGENVAFDRSYKGKCEPYYSKSNRSGRTAFKALLDRVDQYNHDDEIDPDEPIYVEDDDCEELSSIFIPDLHQPVQENESGSSEVHPQPPAQAGHSSGNNNGVIFDTLPTGNQGQDLEEDKENTLDNPEVPPKNTDPQNIDNESDVVDDDPAPETLPADDLPDKEEKKPEDHEKDHGEIHGSDRKSLGLNVQAVIEQQKAQAAKNNRNEQPARSENGGTTQKPSKKKAQAN